MKCFQLEISGAWGHFRKTETSNNPLSHDMITKTAFIGLMGAVLGIERKDMRTYFPLLSEDIIYNVQLRKPVKKISLGFTSCKANNPTEQGVPKSFEILKTPTFLVTIALLNNRSEKIFDSFLRAIKNEEAVYPPCLGWHNCAAELQYVSAGDLSNEERDGVFETAGFVLMGQYEIVDFSNTFRVGFDKLATYQNNDFWNLPEKYVDIIYPEYPNTIKVRGKYRRYTTGNNEIDLCLI